jgi:hypothetical protein
MNKYVVSRNAQSDGSHDVHSLEASCPRLPLPENRKELGEQQNCKDALAQARLEFPKSNGCKFCCLACHTK